MTFWKALKYFSFISIKLNGLPKTTHSTKNNLFKVIMSPILFSK